MVNLLRLFGHTIHQPCYCRVATRGCFHLTAIGAKCLHDALDIAGHDHTVGRKLRCLVLLPSKGDDDIGSRKLYAQA